MSDKKEFYLVDAQAIKKLVEIVNDCINVDLLPGSAEVIETITHQVRLQDSTPDNADIEDHFHFKDRGVTGVQEMLTGIPQSLEVGTLLMRRSIGAAVKCYEFLDRHFIDNDTGHAGQWRNPEEGDA